MPYSDKTHRNNVIDIRPYIERRKRADQSVSTEQMLKEQLQELAAWVFDVTPAEEKNLKKQA